MKKLLFLTILIIGIFFAKDAGATAFYVDFSLAPNGGNGLATTTATSTLNSLVNGTRAVGDVIFVRRGTATTTGMADLTFLSDGYLNNPITITADYDNLWSDFATSSQTFTPTFGSTYMASSASSTDAFPNKWIYVAGDCGETYNATTMNTCEFAYEIASSTPDGISLYLPYKGNQSGAGLYLRVMPSAPQWNTTTGDFQWTMTNDDYWYFKGIDVRGTDSACNISINANRGTKLFDMILQGNGISDCGFNIPNVGSQINKLRIFGFVTGIGTTLRGGIFKDFLIDCNNVASSLAVSNSIGDGGQPIFIDGKITNCTTSWGGYTSVTTRTYFRNIIRKNVLSISSLAVSLLYFEDDFGIVGLNSQSSNQIPANTLATTTISDTSNLRSGGGPTNELIYPPTGTANTGLSTKFFPFSFIKLFEYPIYADTSNKTYTMYFNSTSTTAWNLNPTASEWWIECEAYADASDADRKLTKSTSLFNASSTAWQTFSVNCQPTQSGVLYLRGWYGHPNDGRSNYFFIDNTPVISTP